MNTHTRTYIKLDGMPVLARLIRENLVAFETEFRYLEALYRFHRDEGFCQGQLPVEEIRRSVFEAEYLVFVQAIENDWRKRETRFFSMECLVETQRTKERERAQRVSDVQSLMAALMETPLNERDTKHVAALLGRSFHLAGEYESAYFWLQMAEDGPYSFIPDSLKMAKEFSSGKTKMQQTNEGWQYEPLSDCDKELILRARRRREMQVKDEERRNAIWHE